MKNDTHHQVHGSIPYALLRDMGIGAEEVTDFSATVNPNPLPDRVNNVLRSIDLSAYPDPDCYDARAALAVHLGVDVKCVTMAAGTTELLFALPLLFRNAVCLTPTYGDYSAAYSRGDGSIGSMPFDSVASDPRLLSDKMVEFNADIVIICNPNNPDGSYLESDTIIKLCKNVGNRVVCIDESYQELGDRCGSVCGFIAELPNLIVLKSLSKPYGIGGIRAGYAVASPEVSIRLRKKLLPWGVSTPAQNLVPVLTDMHGYFARQWDVLLTERNRMVERLEAAGAGVMTGRTPFFLVDVGDAAAVRMQLIEKYRMLVRDCASFGMPRVIRIMPSLPDANGKLVDALGDILR